MKILTAILLSMFGTIVLIPTLKELALKFNILDIPDKRKIHEYPVPRIGGIAMAAGAFIPVLLWVPMKPYLVSIIIGSAIVVFSGMLDDIIKLEFKAKFAAQIIAALVVILYGNIRIVDLGFFLPDGYILPPWASIPLTTFFIVGVTNAINLSDGLDGLAGGISLLSLICIGYLAYILKIHPFILISAALIGSIFGFLRFNTFPATIFMGDAGSQLLGFVAICMSLALTQKSTHLSPFLIFLIMGIPLIDTFGVVVQRIMSGKSPFIADKNHLHHKLIDLGFYHSESVILVYIMHAIFICLAFILRFYPDWFILTIYLTLSSIILTSTLVAVKRGWRFKRSFFFENIIKGRLKYLKEKNYIIKFSFKIVEIGFYFLLLFSCFLPENIPANLSLIVWLYLAFVIAIMMHKWEWTNNVLAIGFYLFIPFLMYLSHIDMASWMNKFILIPYNLSFGILTFFVVLTLKYTRRRKGFKFSSMDILILFVALVVPNLPDENIKRYHMGLVAAKIIVFFFTHEVLAGELRINIKWFRLTIILAFLVIGLRGIIG
jgi:UDP-GlcNAc:undecaprenyl-phosphate GlcNAc-1-phosphate transferase